MDFTADEDARKPTVRFDVPEDVLKGFSIGDEVRVTLEGTIITLNNDGFGGAGQGSMAIELSEKLSEDDFSEMVSEEDD